MSGEVANIADVANRVTDDIFKWFKWEEIPIYDLNFSCHKAERHQRKPGAERHPVDVVFRYYDPYLNRYVYLNTDLKSYSKKSIQNSDFKKSIISLARTIDCACGMLGVEK